MTVRLRQQVLDAVVAHARRGHPREVVGLLARSAPHSGDIVDSHPLLNEERQYPHLGFLVSPGALAAAEQAVHDAGLHVAGVYHSHPGRSARWSPADRDSARVGDVHLIVSLRGAVTEIRAWRRVVDRTMEELPVVLVA